MLCRVLVDELCRVPGTSNEVVQVAACKYWLEEVLRECQSGSGCVGAVKLLGADVPLIESSE